MSVCTLDYIPFNYLRYFDEILPAFEQATWGNFTSLKALLASMTEIAHSVRTRYTVPLSGEESQSFVENWDLASLLDVPTLRRVRAGDMWNPWESLAIILPTLEGRTVRHLGQYGELLKSFLLATLCCERSPWSTHWSYHNDGAILSHDEVVLQWETYTTGVEQTRKLWGLFDQPLPQEIMSGKESEQNGHHPRSIFYSLGGSLSGFITHEEVKRFLQQVQTHARSEELDMTIGDCVRDGEAEGWSIEIEELPPEAVKRWEDISGEGYVVHRITGGKYIAYRDLFIYWKQKYPSQMEDVLQRYCQDMWAVEEEILYRMRFAAAHGWGMLQAYSE